MQTPPELREAMSVYSPFAHLVGGPFLMPCAAMNDLRKLQPRVRRPGEAAAAPDAFATWQVEGEIFYSLVCVPDPASPGGQHNVMLLYDHEKGGMHYLRRNLWFSGCPPDTILLAHFIWDDIGGAYHANFLIFDAVRWAGESLAGTPAWERYARLRTLSLNTNTIITLQFVGNQTAVEDFIAKVRAGENSLPHTVKRCITLTDDPYQPVYDAPLSDDV